MEGILALVENAARFVAILGGALAAVFVAYTGILWMTSAGDPQKVSQARGALIGVLAGLILVGMAFLVPGIISETIIEPSGGSRVESLYMNSSCDQHLRRHLVATRAAGNAEQVETIIDAVQARYGECGQDIWDPRPMAASEFGVEDAAEDCAGTPTTRAGVAMGGIPVPALLVEAMVGSRYRVVSDTMRDPFNNILVIWDPEQAPSDSAICWIFYSRFGSWQFGYD